MVDTPREPAGGAPRRGIDDEVAGAILDVAPLLVLVLDREAKILAFDNACERATGFAAREVVGEPVWRLIPEDQRGEVERVFGALRDTGRASVYENDWLTRSGGRRRIAWSNAAVRGSGGAIERVIGTGIDVTELRAAASMSRESELRLGAIVDSAMDAIVSTDGAQRVIVFNPSAEKMFGRASAEVVGRPLDQLIPERFRAAHREHMERFARSAQTSRRMGQLGRVWGLRANGEEFPVEASISQTASESGTLLTAILRDVTERERAAATSALLASIVRSSDDAIVATDLEGRILSWNPAAQKIFGHEQQQIEGSGFTALVAAERFAEIDAVLERARQGQIADAFETVGLRRDDSRFPAHLRVSTRREAAGAIVGALVIVRDVSERRNLERRLRQTEELAAVATLVTGIAHDIGTPMNVILGYTDMLSRSLQGEKERERIRIIQEQVERVTRLIQTLMNFARPQEEASRQLRIEDVAEHALGLIDETARKRGVAIERSFGDAAPILAQGERLERALLDLFVNACDAMAQGGVLRVATRALGDGVEIRVEDTGVGIAPDALGRIFEPFYTTKPRGKGTGLGLLVTRGIVLDHGGTIDVQSEVGKGTAFVIRLPRGSPAAGRDSDPSG